MLFLFKKSGTGFSNEKGKIKMLQKSTGNSAAACIT